MNTVDMDIAEVCAIWPFLSSYICLCQATSNKMSAPPLRMVVVSEDV